MFSDVSLSNSSFFSGPGEPAEKSADFRLFVGHVFSECTAIFSYFLAGISFFLFFLHPLVRFHCFQNQGRFPFSAYISIFIRPFFSARIRQENKYSKFFSPQVIVFFAKATGLDFRVEFEVLLPISFFFLRASA
jgi:hypothetical protein